MDKTAPTAFVFEGFRLDLARRRLSDAAGAPLPLSARAFDVLAYLVENRARVVGKDEIMRAVWSRVVVEENNLNQAIYNLRKVLGDSRETPRFIVTVAGRGYQFIADVRAQPGEPPAGAMLEPGPADADEALARSVPGHGLRAPESAPGQEPTLATTAPIREVAPARPSYTRRWLLATGASAGLGGAVWWLTRRRRVSGDLPSSVAVLPFKPLLEPDANAAIEFGITEILINRLSELPNIVVSPFSSVRRFAGADADPLQAGRDLGVAAVLDGHVQVQGDRLRLTARLLDAQDGHALWSGSFNERLDDFFTVQESLANQVVRALSVELSPRQLDRLTRRDTTDPEAWQLYLNGRYHWNRRTEEGFVRALGFYDAAVSRDPSFALALVGIADVLAVQGVFNMRPPGAVFPRARAAIERAIALDPALAEAHASRGHVVLQYDLDWREGERLYRHALTMQPNLAIGVFWLANCLMMQGRIEESLAEGRRAQALEPMALPFAANLGMLLTLARKLDLAYEQLSGLFDAAPDSPMVRNHFARLHILRGDFGTAIRLLEGFERRAPGSLSNLGRAYALAGRVDDARAELGKLRALGADEYGVGFDAALIHAALGDRAAAIDSLESGLIDRSQMMLFLNVEPGLDALRDEPRFRAVIRKLGLA